MEVLLRPRPRPVRKLDQRRSGHELDHGPAQPSRRRPRTCCPLIRRAFDRARAGLLRPRPALSSACGSKRMLTVRRTPAPHRRCTCCDRECTHLATGRHIALSFAGRSGNRQRRGLLPNAADRLSVVPYFFERFGAPREPHRQQPGDHLCRRFWPPAKRRCRCSGS